MLPYICICLHMLLFVSATSMSMFDPEILYSCRRCIIALYHSESMEIWKIPSMLGKVFRSVVFKLF